MAANERVGGVEMEASLDTSKFEKGVDSIDSSLKKLDPSMQKTERTIKQVESAADGMGKQGGLLSSVFNRLSVSMTAANIAANLIMRGIGAVKNAFVGSIKDAVAFETVLARISTVVEDSTAESIADLRKELIGLSKVYPKSKEELGTGLYNILQAGISDTAEAMKILEVSTKAAIGGVTEVGTAAKVVTDIMGAYNLTADQAVDVMDAVFVGAQRGKAEFSDLAGSLGNVLQSSSQLNVQIPEVVAAIETMVNAGLSSDEAATSLNAFFTAVIQASKGTGEAADLAKKLGLEFNSTALRSKGLKGFMDDLTKAIGDDEVAMQILAGNVRGFRAAASIGGKGAEFFTETLEAMGSETGALDDAFRKMADTTASKWTMAVNAAKNVGEEFGHEMLPALNSGLELATDLMNAAIPVAQSLGDTIGFIAKACFDAAAGLGDVLQRLSLLGGGILRSFTESVGLSTKGVADRMFWDAIVGSPNQPNASTPQSKAAAALLPDTIAGAGSGSRTGAGGGSGGKTREQMARDIEKAEQDVLKALGEQAKANLENVKTRKKELEIRRDLGMATAKELRELERINDRVEFHEEAVDKATKAWEKQKGVVEKIKDEIKDINDEIVETGKELQARFKEIDDRAAEQKTAKIAELVKERDQIRNAATGTGGLTGDMSRRIGEIEAELAGVDPSLLKAGTEGASLTELQQIDKDAELEKVRARKEADAELLESRTKLANKTKELNQAEKDLKIASDDVVKALETLATSSDANFTAIETRTKTHVDTMISQLNRLTAAYGMVYGAGAGEQAAAELKGVAGMKFADGGVVSGPGHDRSDNIPALLSPGERVITAAKNRMYAPVLEAIHNGTFPIRRFADGGPVTNDNSRKAEITINNHGRAAEVFADPRTAKWYAKTIL